MIFQYFDIFSSGIKFHVDKNMGKRKSSEGGIISIIVISTCIAYFSYLLWLYASNGIDPKYKMQIFVSEDRIEISPEDEFFGFNYFSQPSQTIDDLEKQTGKSYLEIIPAFQITKKGQDTEYVKLDVFECKSQKLKGYKCIDFSQSQNYKLVINDFQNYNADLILVVYKCNDTDFFKTNSPSNCASDQEIRKLINNKDGAFLMKMKVSQYNTASEIMESSYKNYQIHLQGDQMVYTKQKGMKQFTKVKKGHLIQSDEYFTSVIDYKKEDRTFDKNSLNSQSSINAISQISISIDEQIQNVEIQYPSFLEVLSIFNSALTVLMCFSIFGEYFSKKLLIQQFQLTLLKDFYSKSYVNLLKMHNHQQETRHKKKVQKIENKINKHITLKLNTDKSKNLIQDENKNSINTQALNQISTKNNNDNIIKIFQDSTSELSQNFDTTSIRQDKIQIIPSTQFNLEIINYLGKNKIAKNKFIKNTSPSQQSHKQNSLQNIEEQQTQENQQQKEKLSFSSGKAQIILSPQNQGENEQLCKKKFEEFNNINEESNKIKGQKNQNKIKASQAQQNVNTLGNQQDKQNDKINQKFNENSQEEIFQCLLKNGIYKSKISNLLKQSKQLIIKYSNNQILCYYYLQQQIKQQMHNTVQKLIQKNKEKYLKINR